jgi:GcrA cell cycle regulator
MTITTAKGMRTNWDDARTATLAKLWAEGLSASSIASRLGDVTRNAVIGKAHRLGLSGRRTPSEAKTGNGGRRSSRGVTAKAGERPQSPKLVRGALALKPAVKAAPAPKPRLVVVPSHETELEPETLRVVLLDLKDHMCRWPVGDPKEADFRFCGRRRVEDRPYCACHACMANRKNKTKVQISTRIRTESIPKMGG